MLRRLAIQATAAAMAAPFASLARAQSGGTLSIVVPYAPGGSSDRAARIIADKLGGVLGQTVIVENKTGAGGRVAMQQTKGVAASQSVLVLANPATMVVAPLSSGSAKVMLALDAFRTSVVEPSLTVTLLAVILPGSLMDEMNRSRVPRVTL